MSTISVHLHKHIRDPLQIVEDLAFGSDVSLRITKDEC